MEHGERSVAEMGGRSRLRREINVRCGLVGKVELAEDEAVEVIDSRELGALVAGEVEGLFCAEDDFYEVEAHGMWSTA